MISRARHGVKWNYVDMNSTRNQSIRAAKIKHVGSLPFPHVPLRISNHQSLRHTVASAMHCCWALFLTTHSPPQHAWMASEGVLPTAMAKTPVSCPYVQKWTPGSGLLVAGGGGGGGNNRGRPECSLEMKPSRHSKRVPSSALALPSYPSDVRAPQLCLHLPL